MNFIERLKVKEEAARLLFKSEKYSSKIKIDFVLSKENKMIIGFQKDNDERIYIYQPYAKSKRYIKDNRIHYYDEKYNSLFDTCIDGYILLQLSRGYELAFMTLNAHYSMWNFIDAFMNEMEYIEAELTKYLEFCFETGITKKVIDEFQGYLNEDLFKIFMEHTDENSSVLVSNRIGTKSLTLESTLSKIFIIRLFEKETYQVEIIKKFDDLEDALMNYIQLYQEVLSNFTAQVNLNFDKSLVNSRLKDFEHEE